ncbi:OadG family transporter subunit [Hydrogenimonas sp. SS33]|uniref:OadG family protein n=1 Tax=Hydrogenimonas leucolamina TaxID=2954236 RepID=UPI00336BB42F
MEDMVAESFKYTILGMGVVFGFLYSLVLLLRLQKLLIARFFGKARRGAVVPAAPRQRSWQGDEIRRRRKKTAAIIAAVHHHKREGKAR